MAASNLNHLVLNGVSGSASKRLAVINNHTFEVGEDGEVPTPTGKLKIHVEEIGDDKVVVLVGFPPQRIELKLRENFRPK